MEYNDTIVTARSLSKYYNHVCALRNLDLTIERGRITGLLGPNGSGKTTLIKVFANLLKQYSGEVLIEGQRPGVATKEIVAYLPDQEFLDPTWSVDDAISAYSTFFADFSADHAWQMLQQVNFDVRLRFGELSKGNKEKLQLILTLARKARLYILDEPIAGVDPAAREVIFNLILNNYNREGAILICTHLVRDVEEILDDVMFINNGQIILKDDARRLTMERQMNLDQIFREIFRCY